MRTSAPVIPEPGGLPFGPYAFLSGPLPPPSDAEIARIAAELVKIESAMEHLMPTFRLFAAPDTRQAAVALEQRVSRLVTELQFSTGAVVIKVDREGARAGAVDDASGLEDLVRAFEGAAAKGL